MERQGVRVRLLGTKRLVALAIGVVVVVGGAASVRALGGADRVPTGQGVSTVPSSVPSSTTTAPPTTAAPTTARPTSAPTPTTTSPSARTTTAPARASRATTTAPPRATTRTTPAAGSTRSAPAPKPTPSRTPARTTQAPPPPPSGSRAQQVLALVNAERSKAGCRAVSADPRLQSAAQKHSADMAAQDYFSHTSKDGRSFSDRIRAAGYTGGAIAENIAAGQSTASAVMQGWMKSSGHRANIVNCAYTAMGLGYASGGSYGHYWTQDFGG